MTKTKHIRGKYLVRYGPNAMKMRLEDGFAFRRKNGPYIRTPWATFSWFSINKVLYVRVARRWLSVQQTGRGLA